MTWSCGHEFSRKMSFGSREQRSPHANAGSCENDCSSPVVTTMAWSHWGLQGIAMQTQANVISKGGQKLMFLFFTRMQSLCSSPTSVTNRNHRHRQASNRHSMLAKVAQAILRSPVFTSRAPKHCKLAEGAFACITHSDLKLAGVGCSCSGTRALLLGSR